MFNISFRVDSSRKIGTGHMVRCLTLANSFKENGANSTFYCRHCSEDLVKSIKNSGHGYVSLNFGEEDCDENNEYESWLGCEKEKDAEYFLNNLKHKPDLLIIDHYSLDYVWEDVVKSYVSKIFVIDDLANRKHNCDFLLDQNYFTNYKERYQNLVNENCIKLLGPKYSILRPEFREFRKEEKAVSYINPSILVFYGGIDLTGETVKFLKSIKSFNSSEVPWRVINIVIGESNTNKKEIFELSTSINSTQVHVNTTEMAKLLADSDVSFCSSGTFTWERFCLGIPAYVTSCAENQRQVSEDLGNSGIIKYLGHYDSVGHEQIFRSLQKFLANGDSMIEQSNKIIKLVDGAGVYTIMDQVFKSFNTGNGNGI